jgi:tetratricopeptide (TPR) repeat protein
MTGGMIGVWGAVLVLAAGGQALAADAADPPWKAVQVTLANLEPRLSQGGVLAVESAVPELEAALLAAPKTHLVQLGERRYALVDTASHDLITEIVAAEPGGPIPINPSARKEVVDDWGLASMASYVEAEGDLAKDKHAEVQLVRDPYPFVALLLGSYFNERKRPEEALRWLDLGLALPSQHYAEASALEAGLVTERGIALSALHRLAEAVAADDRELTRSPMKDQDRARLLRNKAFALTDLGELDRAASAYAESLKLEPGNAIALHELEYIRRLKDGQRPTETQLTIPGAAPTGSAAPKP